ncbi:uncharacterized protein Z518_07669 [Rhinocladiella mackenziei CBS 650.93]|uniref:Rhinocladiella mackenziei CBS 650.93 unplaced genomic scaffold supercont1.5, whole genome shotgun sequence n=1 Tax=Rhinocladiella mackenziei CBS 650.93 TaxID=1442369 RepID=A0A0D2ILP5_9EURO|nr:uncharacterized protein Z518_07669 [Rhinocladiella mackenziei CBS 650.93]KIX04116.1 hypothetical protein Z518_07669 [Rhinocladiella mackenziei CBS 650.93]
MARLNDPPVPPTESIDALKRRFIRQNREIARVNSTQSQRIRNLETEISRLVAENISLREQAITAQVEAERWRNASNVDREILDIKERLEKKMKEVSLLIVEMGDIPEKITRKGRRKSRLDNSKSLTEQDWRYRQSMREALADEREESHDGRLPVIQEDKLYPRRTLESAEVMAIRDEEAIQQASESPELGPPPMAHFDVPESVATEMPEEENNVDMAPLLPTLERRRKRRTSALLQDMPTEEASETSLPERRAQQLLKSGAKRKLDVSELDEPVIQQSSENDGFIFQRRQDIWNNGTAGKKSSRFTRPPGRENEKPVGTESQSPEKTAAGVRKILAPKSTNSPAKRRVHISEKLSALERDAENQQQPDATRPARGSNLPSQLETHEAAPEPSDQQETNDIPPKTPAASGEDVLSPISSEPSSRTAPQPKEAAILNSVEDVLNGSIGRGSRRARAAVSYAEPNLRDKMRRPGKELVGAVEGIEKNKDNPAAATTTRVPKTERAKSDGPKEVEEQSGPTKVKHEKGVSGGDRWKELPYSMSSKKDEPASPLRDKERKDKDRDRDQTKIEWPRDPKNPREQTYSDDLEKAVDRLKIFDPPSSSPIAEPKAPIMAKDGTKAATTATGSKRKTSAGALGRRHSAQHSSSSIYAGSDSGDSSMVGTAPTTSSSSSHSNTPLPTPSSAASLRTDPAHFASGKELKRSSSVSSNLKRKTNDVNAPEGTGTSTVTSAQADSRAEKIANRRRSMMV